MISNGPINNHEHWTRAQKMAFRFFFPFLTLQLAVTEAFWSVSFNLFDPMLKWSEKVYVQPCLWLNNHLFHFKYIAPYWSIFSPSLRTIRGIAYLFLSCLICIVWTIFDRKRTNYNRLFYWFNKYLVAALACILFFYGALKTIPLQMRVPTLEDLRTPAGDMSPFELVWTLFGYGKPYQSFGGFLEVAGALLILFRRTRVAGLLLASAVMINVLILNYTYQIGVLVFSFYILLTALFLLAPYAGQLWRFFFFGQPGILSRNEYVPARNFKTKLFKVIATLLFSISFIITAYEVYGTYTRRQKADQSRQYSLVKNFIVNNDIVQLRENDTTRWRIWNERISNGKRTVTITTMKPGVSKTYTLERDSLKHVLTLHPPGKKDTASIHFMYTDINQFTWRLNGTVQLKNIQVELQKINPDTTENLLKIKRTIITFDDDPGSE